MKMLDGLISMSNGIIIPLTYKVQKFYDFNPLPFGWSIIKKCEELKSTRELMITFDTIEILKNGGR